MQHMMPGAADHLLVPGQESGDITEDPAFAIAFSHWSCIELLLLARAGMTRGQQLRLQRLLKHCADSSQDVDAAVGVPASGRTTVMTECPCDPLKPLP